MPRKLKKGKFTVPYDKKILAEFVYIVSLFPDALEKLFRKRVQRGPLKWKSLLVRGINRADDFSGY
jgi:hypothetical protein